MSKVINKQSRKNLKKPQIKVDSKFNENIEKINRSISYITVSEITKIIENAKNMQNIYKREMKYMKPGKEGNLQYLIRVHTKDYVKILKNILKHRKKQKISKKEQQEITKIKNEELQNLENNKKPNKKNVNTIFKN